MLAKKARYSGLSISFSTFGGHSGNVASSLHSIFSNCFDVISLERLAWEILHTQYRKITSNRKITSVFLSCSIVYLRSPWRPLSTVNHFIQQKQMCGGTPKSSCTGKIFCMCCFYIYWNTFSTQPYQNSRIVFFDAPYYTVMAKNIGTLGKYDQRRLLKSICIINPFDILFKKKNLTFYWIIWI